MEIYLFIYICQYPIKNPEKIGLDHFNDLKAFVE